MVTSSSVVTAPDFRHCLIEQLLPTTTPLKCTSPPQPSTNLTKLTNENTEPTTKTNSFTQATHSISIPHVMEPFDHSQQLSFSNTPSSRTIITDHSQPVTERSHHDRLPITLAIESGSVEDGSTVGVRRITLISTPEDLDQFKRTCHSDQPSVSSVTSSTLTTDNTDKFDDSAERPLTNSSVRYIEVPLSHAARCPCRSLSHPHPTATTDETDSVQPQSVSSSHPLFRLAVVVVPTLYSVTHCTHCQPSLPPDTTPAVRVLITRRPSTMRAFPQSWVFPGGACDPTDLNLEHTGMREVMEETSLMIDSSNENSMVLVSLWEAVYPVIKPADQVEPFLAKARYVVVMFSGRVTVKDTDKNTIDLSTPSTNSSKPVCVGCLPLQLCPTEVDASVWLTGEQFDQLRQHAHYYHTDEELTLTNTVTNRTRNDAVCGYMGDSPASGSTCSCDYLPARFTIDYLEQHPSSTKRLVSPPTNFVDDTNSIPSSSDATIATTSTAAPSTQPSQSNSSVPPSTIFHLGLIRMCTLGGLYPNRIGSGMAEGHLVALEEMRERRLF